MFLSEPSSNFVRQDLAEVMPFVTIWAIVVHPSLPYLQSWNFSVQDQLGGGRTLEVLLPGATISTRRSRIGSAHSGRQSAETLLVLQGDWGITRRCG